MMRKENRLSLKRLFWDYDFSEKELEDLFARQHSQSRAS